MLAGGTVQAASITWDGGTGGTGTSWNDATNWSGDVLPGAQDDVLFVAAGTGSNTSQLIGSGKIISLDASHTINNLNINSYGSPFAFVIGSSADISAGHTLTLTNVFRAANNSHTQTIAANVKLAGDSTWNIVTGFNGFVAVTGGIGSDSAVIFTKDGTNTLTLNGANTFTGSLRALGGTLSLGGTNAYTGTSTVSGGTLLLDFNAGAGAPLANIINSSSALVLGGVRGGGTVTANGKAGASTSQTFNGTTLDTGASTLNITNGNTANTRTLVNLGAISRNAGSTVNFVQPTGTGNTAIAANNGYTTSTGNDASGIIGAWATVGGTEYATNNGTNIVAYTGYTDQAGNVMADAPTTNLRITSGTTGSITQGAGTTTVNTLRVNDAAARTVTVGAGNTLRVNGILATGTAGLTIGEAANAGTLTAGSADNTAAELIVNNTTAVTVNSVVADNGTGAVTFTKSGTGTTTLAATNTYTGGTTVNAGILAFAPNTSISSATTNTSTTVTVSSTAGLSVGQTVTGAGIPANTRIASINVNGTQYTLSQAATATAGAANLVYYTGGTTNALSATGNIVVNGGTLELGSTSASQATSGAVILAGGTLSNGTITKSGSNYDVRSGTISSKLAGSVGLDKTTSGTLTFANTVNNTYTGTTTISEGSVTGSATNVVSISGNLVVGSASGGNAASFSGNGNNTNNFDGTKSITVYSNGSVSFGSGSSQATSAVTILGGSVSGQVYQGATVNMTGGTWSATSYGNVQSFTSSASSSTAVVSGSLLGGQATRTFTVADGVAAIDLLFSGGTASSTSSLTKAGAGYMSMTGTKAYTGNTTLSGGTLAAAVLADGGVNSSIGASSNAATNLRLGNGTTFEYTGSGHSTDRLFTVNGTAAADSATLNASGTGAANFTNTGSIAWGTTAQTRTLKLGGTSTANNTLASTIANNGSGLVSLTKQDAGKWIISGTNTYTGATTINGGSLIVNGSLAALSAVTVNSGGTLGGSGTIGGSVTVASGGFLAPGNSPGILTVGSLTLASGSTTSFEIAGAAVRGTDFDGINVTTNSGLTYGGALNLAFTSTLTNGDLLDLFSFTGTAGGSFTSVVSTGLYAGSWNGSAGVWTFEGNGQVLTFTESTGDLSVAGGLIPEPSTYAVFVGLAALAVAGRRSRRRV